MIMCASVVGHDQRNKNIGATKQAPDDASKCTIASLLQHKIEKKRLESIWKPCYQAVDKENRQAIVEGNYSETAVNWAFRWLPSHLL